MECSCRIGGDEIRFTCHSHLKEQGAFLLQILEEFAATEKGLFDGCKIQFGWSFLAMYRRPYGYVLCEPDFGRNPLSEWREDLSATLAVNAMIADVVVTAKVEPAEICFDQRIVIEKGCLQDPRVYAHRTPPTSANDSGWFIGRVAKKGAPPLAVSDLSSLYVFELLRERPRLMSILGLPTEYLAVFEGDTIEAVLNPADVNIWKRPPPGA